MSGKDEQLRVLNSKYVNDDNYYSNRYVPLEPCTE
jgi:hypothetical protein